MVIENDKKQSSKLIADELANQTEEKLPSELTLWVLDSILNQHNLDPKNMGKTL